MSESHIEWISGSPITIISVFVPVDFTASANVNASVTMALLDITNVCSVHFTVPPSASLGPLPWLVAEKFHCICMLYFSRVGRIENMNMFLNCDEGPSVHMSTFFTGLSSVLIKSSTHAVKAVTAFFSCERMYEQITMDFFLDDGISLLCRARLVSVSNVPTGFHLVRCR